MKSLKRIGDSLFKISDSFFTGVTDSTAKYNDQNNTASTNENIQSVTWELNQGVEDIILNDFIAIIRYMVPVEFRNLVKKFYHDACVYFMVDNYLEEASENPENKTGSPDLIAPGITLNNTLVIGTKKSGFKSKIVSLLDWPSISRIGKFNCKSTCTYYLLGDFSPAYSAASFTSSGYNQGRIMKFIFPHTCFYHKRN